MQIRHTSDIINLLQTKYQNNKIIKQLNPETRQWENLTGEAVAANCIAAAKGLAQLGIAPGERIGVYSPNKSEFLYIEMGMFAMRAVSVPLYATSSPDQVFQIAKNASVSIIFVGEQYQYNNAFQVQKELGQIKQIIIFDRAVVRQFDDHTSIYYDEFVRMGDSMSCETTVKVRMGETQPEDLATLIYTSGTTGQPKGVQVLHKAIAIQIDKHSKVYASIGTSDTSVNFLPLSHIFEKVWSYFCLSRGVRIAIVTNPKRIQELMPQIKPTLMCNVPRYWEKVYQGVEMHISQSPKFLAKIYRHAIKVGHRYRLDYWNKFKKPPLFLSLGYWFYSNTIFFMLRRAIGLQYGRFFPTAGSLLSDEINVFLQSVGIPIIVGYGLSESCATVSAYMERGFTISSIGEVFPGVEVRIDPETNEIQLRGETITLGYYQNEEANREAFTADGWFRTGDAGRLEGNTLYFKERIKDLFKTANGKYIAPQQIENLLSSNPLFEQVAVIADERKFVSALIYPNWELLTHLCRERGVLKSSSSKEDMKNDSTVQNIVMATIEQLQSSLATFEKIKRITLITEPFSADKKELTPTLKLRRKVIQANYAEEIEKMYV
ncbi:AMP-dependent synthetase/ligase [Porphyromonas gingivicanis]|uniref:AMP-dependent synthetase/ligase n=1 Tax=Porphyromonas gingivicanis TaxID=266762 RepID=UPI00046FE561|nr:long-chain fatty acid--CoA ligase [Porphyromonas gingivicanis]